MENKTCNICNVEKPLNDFYTYSSGSYFHYCKKCSNKKSKIWRSENVERKKEINIKYMSKEENFIRSAFKRIFKPSSMFPKQYNSNYKRKGWVPEITLDELYAELILHIQRMKDKFSATDGRLCRYCYIPWTYSRPTKGRKDSSVTFTNFSIDRFDAAVTYKIGNIIFCCAKCNSTKKNSTKQDWLRYLEIDKELND